MRTVASPQSQESIERLSSLRYGVEPVAYVPFARRPPSFCAGEGEAGVLDFAWYSAIGQRHAKCNGVNEDSVAVGQNETCLHAIVADGVSTGAFGAVASEVCARHLAALRVEGYSLNEDGSQTGKVTVQSGIRAANAVVANAIARFSKEEGATTFSGLWFSTVGNGWVSRCGDCRVWLFWRDQAGKVSLHQLGEDQTYATTGETPYSDNVPPSNPSRMIGVGEECIGEPDVWDVTLSPGAGVMLTSDGVHGVLDVAYLRAILEEGLRCDAPLADIVDEIRAAVREGGIDDDDASVFLLYRWHLPS